LACEPIEGVEQVLSAPGVFIGDIHGSQESPAFLRDLSCHAMQSGRPLVVAMEYDAADQAVLDDFLRSANEQAASRMLVGTPHWAQNIDGRASPAMRDALLAIRRHARAGGEVELLACDLRGAANSQQRDTASAQYILRKREKDGAAAYWIVFGGNVHARKTRGLTMPGAPAGYADHEPLGYQIRNWNLIHLNAYYRGGASWGCVGPDPSNCQVRPLSGTACTTDCPAHTAIRLRRSDPAYDGVYDVGKLTASPPLYRR
jgi:hypothetical protein